MVSETLISGTARLVLPVTKGRLGSQVLGLFARSCDELNKSDMIICFCSFSFVGSKRTEAIRNVVILAVNVNTE